MCVCVFVVHYYTDRWHKYTSARFSSEITEIDRTISQCIILFLRCLEKSNIVK